MCNLVIPVAFLAILNLLQCVLGGDTTLSEWTEAPVVFPFKTSRIACGYNSATDEFWASGGPDGAKLLSYNIGCDNLTEFADVSEQIFTEGSPFTQYNNTLFFADDSHLGSLDMDTGEFNYNISRKLNLRGYSTCLETSPDGRYIFLIGGHTNANGIESRAYLYDLELGILTTGSQFNNQPYCCSARSCNVIGDRLYVFGGWKRDANMPLDVVEYLDISDLSTFAAQPWMLAPFTMINPSQIHQTVVFNEYVYKFGVSTVATDEIERYDVEAGIAETEGRLFPFALSIRTFCAVTAQDRILVAVLDGLGGKLYWASKDGDTVPTACGPTRAPTGVTGEPSSVTEAPTGRPTADQTTSTALWTTGISTTDLFSSTTSNTAVDAALSAQDSAIDKTMMVVAISLGVLLVLLMCAAAVLCLNNKKNATTSYVGNLEAIEQDVEPAQHEPPVEVVSASTEMRAKKRSVSSLYAKDLAGAGIHVTEEYDDGTPGITRTRAGSEGATAEDTRSPSVVEGRVSIGGEGERGVVPLVRNETGATREFDLFGNSCESDLQHEP